MTNEGVSPPRAARGIAATAAALVGAAGLVVLGGWYLDLPALKGVVSGLPTMKANTALAFVFAGAALFLGLAGGERAGPNAARLVLLAIVAAIGLLTLVEYAAGVDLQIDQALFVESDARSAPHPGRPSLLTAANFVLFGAAMLLARRHEIRWPAAFTASCLVGLASSLLAVIGYAYGAPLLYRPVPSSSIAAHTAAAFIVLFVGTLASRPDIGLVALLRSSRTGGVMLRRLLPAVILLPPILGWLRLQGEIAGLYDARTGLALFALANAAILGAVVAGASRQADRLDAERRRSGAALRATESRFLAFVQNAPFVTYLKGTDGRYLFHNREAERVFGASDAELKGKAAREVESPAAAAEIEAADRRVLATGDPLVVERHAPGSGGYEWAMAVKFPIRDEADRIVAIGGFDIDITERKRAEAALRLSEESLRQSEYRYRRVVDLIQEAVWIHREGEIVFANPAAAKLFGAPGADALIGRSIFSLLHPDDRARAEERTRIMMEKGAGLPLAEMRLVGLDGRTRIGELRAVPFEQEGRLYILSAGRDVTEQRTAEAQLRHAQKLEAVGQLTGGVAHDFNNLLTVIIGSLDAAVERVPADARALIEAALRGAERGAALVKRLLAFSRKQTLSPEPLDFNRIATEMDGLLRRTLGEQIEIELRPHAGLWPALADRGQVESALLNLAINARDAMPAGGKLTIETDNVHLDADYAARNAEVAPGDYALLAVTDTGTGMPPEVVERAFEPFFTTKEVGKGTGLGLSTIYGFAKQSRGHLKIYSEPGHGTTVRLYLPRAAAGEAAAGAPAAVPREHPRGGETILVVEDDPLVRAFVVAQLDSLGYRVLEAADGPQAQQLLDGDAVIDLLFTDIVMPGGITGRQLADRARERRPRLKALFTSGYTENAVVHHGTLDPGVHFLSKPYVRRDLALKVREALDSAD